MIKDQLTLYLDNKPGVLAKIARLMGAAGVNLEGISVAESDDTAMVQIVVSNAAKAKSALHEIMGSADRGSAEEEMARFVAEYEPRYPKATASLLADKEQLLSFYDFPAEHWRHLRTTNPVESSFATVKVRTRRTKGAGSRKAGLALAFKLILSAQDRWRKLNGAHLLPLVARGAQFKDGTLVPKERDRLPDHSTDSTASEEIAA